MNTREIAEEYRLLHWAGTLRERKTSGQSIRAYCKQAGIHENVFYYWQRKLRETALDELSGQSNMQPTVPEGWTLCATETTAAIASAKSDATASEQLMVEVGGLRITASSAYPVEQLARLLRGLTGRC